METAPPVQPEETVVEPVGVPTKFNLTVVENAEFYTKDRARRYKFTTDKDELEMKCELCLELPCCPEHCCDWDTC